jgi:hypothetical protein
MYNGLDNLESHELFSTINRIKAKNYSASYGFNKFRNEVCKDYINCLLDFHKKEIYNFIKGEAWDLAENK